MTHQYHVAGAMIWRGLKPVLIAAAMAAVGISAGNAAEVSAALAQKAPEAATLAANAEADGSVRVIVTFASSVDSSSITPADVESVQATVTAGQDAILADHFGSATALSEGQGFARSLQRMIISPAFAINVTGAELDALAADPRVVNVSLDHESFPTLIQSLPLIGMPAAYSAGGTGNGMAVAILDTGVQNNHEFFVGKIVAEVCFSSPAAGENSLCPLGGTSQIGAGASNSTTPLCFTNGIPATGTEICEHGTHVAGIAAGYNTSYNAGEPTNGVAKFSNIIGGQVFHRRNAGCSGGNPCVSSYDSDQMAALEYIYANYLTLSGGVRLASINLSLGSAAAFSGTCDSQNPTYASDLQALRNAGVAVIYASGNDGSTSLISYPACLSPAIAVGSSDKSDVISWFSNMSNKVELMAPGGKVGGVGDPNDILSSYASGISTSTYQYLAGTSMAAPHVAGAFAAVRSACGNVPFSATGVNVLLDAFKTTGVTIFDTRAGGTWNRPRIQVDAALNQACGYVTPAPVVVALDPLTLSGLAILAVIGIGWQFRRRQTV